LALADLSITVYNQAGSELIPRKEGWELAKMLAAKAYELDSNLAEANTALGLAMSPEEDQSDAEKLFLRAIELNPNYMESYRRLSFIYLRQADYEKEIEVLAAGRKIDPTSYMLAYEHVVAYQAANRCDKSLEILPEVIELGGGNANGDNNLEGVTYSVCGKYEEALPILYKILANKENANPSSSLLSQLGYSNAKIGNKEKALEFAKMIEDKKDNFVYEKVMPIYLALGDKEKVLQLLNEMAKKAPQRFNRLSFDLRLNPLKNEPLYQELLKKMNLS
jgi:tetratricopeptide (TPR) repeat protein